MSADAKLSLASCSRAPQARDMPNQDLERRMLAFFDAHIYPSAAEYQQEYTVQRQASHFIPSRLIAQLKGLAREAGLWNLFLPRSTRAPQGLSNAEYAPLCEIMGRVSWSAEVFNCSAPDTGNMEALERYGTEAQNDRWLEPLLAGEIRSAFLMTEPQVASSDATNIQCSIRSDGDSYLVNGRKWWATGAHDPRCKLFIVMGKTDPSAATYRQQSMLLVPADAPGVRIVRDLTVFGYDHAPHGHAEVVLEDVRVPKSEILLGEGRGFEIAQGRLGPGRVHHCMRSIGTAEAALHAMCVRLHERIAFGKPLSEQSLWRQRIAEARCLIDQARALVLRAAEQMDRAGNKAARKEIAMIKVVVPNMALQVIDWAIQAHGGAGLSDDFPLASMFAEQRVLRLADGPDEVHNETIARLELATQVGAA
jgi:acyl-CoA dehydrogenase